jgi:hypothetical protein
MTLRAQTPAEGILIHKDWGNSRYYSVTCECLCADHTHHVFVDADESGITVTTHTTQKTQFWSTNRWRTIWTLLTKGYVDYEASLIMTEQQAMNYASTLHHAVEDVTKFKASTK